jgi:RNA polymerase sigma-70 factor (ECF subfamily)
LIGGARAAAADGDRQLAFERLTGASLDQAYRIAAVILGNGPDAEDATQDAVVQAWRSFGTLRDTTRFDAWFQRILVNVCRDRLRKRRRTPVTELSLATSGEPSAGFDAVEDRMALERAFARLTPDQAITVVLRFHVDLTQEDVAARMGVPIGTVKSRLHAALAALQLALSGTEAIDL